MVNQKNNRVVIILMGVIIVILAVLCVLFATGTISFKNNVCSNIVKDNGTDEGMIESKKEEDSIIDENNKEDSREDSKEKVSSSSKKLPEWMEYVLDSSLVSAKIVSFLNFPYESSERVKILNKDEVRELFESFDNCKIQNIMNEDGFGGPEINSAKIFYIKDDDEYSITLNWGVTLFVDEKLDSKLVGLLEKEYPREFRDYGNNTQVVGSHIFSFRDCIDFGKYFK